MPDNNSAPHPNHSSVPLVHAVTTDEVVGRADFVDVACAVMGVLGPRGALHLRAAHLSGACDCAP